ncbi:hypothetical protein LP419_05655 [Massilia sp. H-1]|nr:hypothetical protein LP419_05655 [Massilia sp. H-1]
MWLVALLTNAQAEQLRPAERKAAAAVKADSPTYVSLQYHLARLAIAEGRVKQADSAVTALLKAPLATTTRNRLLRMKMVTAPTAEASLAAGPRMLGRCRGGADSQRRQARTGRAAVRP